MSPASLRVMRVRCGSPSNRTLWPEVELDIISGFVVNPLPLLDQGEAELAIIHDRPEEHATITFSPLFRYESVALMSPRHRLASKPWLDAGDFAEAPLITYPVPDEMLDVMKHCLTPANINPKRRTAELTVAILQLVASGRGIAALPSWTVGNYIERGYVVSRPIGQAGLRCELYAATTRAGAEAAYIREFIALTRKQSLTELAGVSAL
jgi:LysR family transcriptional regulator for metE and metH